MATSVGVPAMNSSRPKTEQWRQRHCCRRGCTSGGLRGQQRAGRRRGGGCDAGGGAGTADRRSGKADVTAHQPLGWTPPIRARSRPAFIFGSINERITYLLLSKLSKVFYIVTSPSPFIGFYITDAPVIVLILFRPVQPD
uniref:Uncharacterized protein n=1 Tax=Oryza sativa subsp. japonica TaxID=39947 RepID=Q2R292_ORYSJ|nr:hypothetical protein LOC_Os11g36580 [Oryza sativa Japonica Group]